MSDDVAKFCNDLCGETVNEVAEHEVTENDVVDLYDDQESFL